MYNILYVYVFLPVVPTHVYYVCMCVYLCILSGAGRKNDCSEGSRGDFPLNERTVLPFNFVLNVISCKNRLKI